MNYRVCCSVLLLLSCVAWSAPDPNKTIQIKQDIRPGTRYITTSITYYLTSKVNSEPTKVIYALRQRAVFREDTSKPDAEGFTTVTMTPLQIQSHRPSAEKPQYDLDYDSKTAPADSPLGKIFQPMLKCRYIITIDPAGTFRNMIIKGNPWAKMKRACPESKRWMGPLITRMFGIPTMTEIFTLPTTYLPTHAVKQGDTWRSPTTYYLRNITDSIPFEARVNVSSITEDDVKFTLSDILYRSRELKMGGMYGRPVGKVVFNRNTNTVTEVYVNAIYGHNVKLAQPKGIECIRKRLLMRLTVSDKLPKLKPLPPVPKPVEEAPIKPPAAKAPTTQPAAKSPTTKPASPATPKTEKKTPVTAP
jgi:hypothetical protein